MNTQLTCPPPITDFHSFLHYPRFWSNIASILRNQNPFYMTFAMVQRRLVRFSSLSHPQLRQRDAAVHHVRTSDGEHVTAIVFRPTARSALNSQCVLMASPNACRHTPPCSPVGIAEFSYGYDPVVSFYTQLGFFVVAYNYRGSGDSTGVVTPDNTVSDALCVAEMMRQQYHASLAIVHGVSIGGYVVQGCSTHAPFLVYDRNFRDMDSVVQHFVR